MGRITGVVMEQEGTHVIVFTSTGEFKRIRCRGRLPEIGDEIIVRTRGKNRMIQRISWAVAAAVLLLALASPLSMIANQPPERAVAWVTVDINPSLELTISNRDRVIEVSALNEDGQKVLNKVDVMGMNPQKAVAKLTGEALNMGYIGKAKDNSVLIAVTGTVKEYDSQKLQKNLMVAAQETIEDQRVVAVVQTVTGTPEFREQARKKEISTGKYAVLIEAVNQGVLITEEEIKSNSVTEAIKQAGGEPEVILKKAHEEKVEQLPEKEKKYLMIAGEMKRNEGEKSGDEGKASSPKDSEGTNAVDKPQRDDKVPMISPIGNKGAEQTKPSTIPEQTKQPGDSEDKAGTNTGSSAQPGNKQEDDQKDQNDNINDIGKLREKDNSMN